MVIATGVGVVSLSAGAAGSTTTFKTEMFGGYSIRLPSAWPDRSPSQCLVGRGNAAKTLQGPAIVVGSAPALGRYGFDCLAIHPQAPVVVLGYGGPPVNPVPSFPIATRKINGVAVHLYGARARHERAVYFLALLPSRSQWILVSMPLQRAQKARNKIWSLLSTLHAVTRRPKDASPPRGPLLGKWAGGSGVSLNIAVEGTKVIGILKGETYKDPTEVTKISLRKVADNNLEGLVLSVRFVNSHGKAIAEPLSLEDYPVGDRFLFMFLTKHILEVIQLKGRNRSDPLGNTSYYCRQALVSPSTSSDFNC
jgi:hypothetical protein